MVGRRYCFKKWSGCCGQIDDHGVARPRRRGWALRHRYRAAAVERRLVVQIYGLERRPFPAPEVVILGVDFTGRYIILIVKYVTIDKGSDCYCRS
jgi:hypothetical protein